MPCSTKVALPKILSAVQRLEKALELGSVKVVIGAQGAVAFSGWKDNDGVADLCAYRRLLAQNSPALRRAVARAEALAGKPVNRQAIAQGLHSHDGGQTWSKH